MDNYPEFSLLPLHTQSIALTKHTTILSLFQNTPDFNPILDVHPAWKNIVIAAGFSGNVRYIYLIYSAIITLIFR